MFKVYLPKRFKVTPEEIKNVLEDSIQTEWYEPVIVIEPQENKPSKTRTWWTPEEMKRVEQLYLNQVPMNHIAERLGRSSEAVYSKLKSMEVYRPHASYETHYMCGNHGWVPKEYGVVTRDAVRCPTCNMRMRHTPREPWGSREKEPRL